ncbi:MAG: hypothetical protein KDC06_02455 [Chitinophagaceae bacterium]|nr:hypothetical protein [Chitinophagaceae bacterium]
MKKIFLSAVIVSMALAVNAQTIPDRKMDKTFHHQDMRKGHRMDLQKLNLTDAQKAQFKAQREDFKNKMAALKKEDNITVKEWRTKMQALRQENKTKTESIFTPEQKDQLKKMQAERQQKRKEMMQKKGEKMKKALNLTDAQSKQLKDQREATQKQMKAIKENDQMTPAQKKEAIQQLMKSSHEKRKSIFTEEQKQKMKDMRQHKPQDKKVKPQTDKS